MAVTSGFFNSSNGDRKYNAEQFSSLFNGIINDGVFMNIGTAFKVEASSGTIVNVGLGRAWFNSAWIHNDSVLQVPFPESELILGRIDALVFEVDHSTAVRAGTIKVVKGVPASTPVRPTMADTVYCHQHPIAYVVRAAGSNVINESRITYVIGTSECPFITGILEVLSIDNIVAQWEAEWDDWSAQWVRWSAEWDAWFSNEKAEVDEETTQFLIDMKADILTWFSQLQVMLDGDVAANLAGDILELENRFQILATERKIYNPLQDSNSLQIEDSYGLVIEGATSFVESGASYTGGGVDARFISAQIGTEWEGVNPPFIQVIPIMGISTNDKPIVDLVPSEDYTTADKEVYDFGQIYKIATSSNRITVYASGKTDVPLNIQMVVMNDG